MISFHSTHSNSLKLTAVRSSDVISKLKQHLHHRKDSQRFSVDRCPHTHKQIHYGFNVLIVWVLAGLSRLQLYSQPFFDFGKHRNHKHKRLMVHPKTHTHHARNPGQPPGRKRTTLTIFVVVEPVFKTPQDCGAHQR